MKDRMIHFDFSATKKAPVVRKSKKTKHRTCCKRFRRQGSMRGRKNRKHKEPYTGNA